MPEPIQEETTQQLDIGRYLDIVRRRHLQFLIPLFFGWLVVWGSSWVLPPRYKSNTLILVEQPTMPANLVTPNVNENLQDRLQSMTQQILSRTRLLLIIDKLNLYRNEHRTLTPDQKVALMQKDIDIELVRDPQNDAINAFRISYSAPDPREAQRVTSELTNLFIDESTRVREQESEDTTRFMEDQVASVRSSLADQDAKVRTFQAQHEGELPDQQASNLQILSGLQSQMQNEQDALNAARQQRVYHQSLIDQYKALQGTTNTATEAPTGLAGIDQRLETLRAKLTDLSTRYTDQYPEIQDLKEEIAKTEKTRDQFIASMQSAVNGKEHTKDSKSQSQFVTDPAQDAPFLQLQSQLQADQVEISNREQAIASLKSRIDQYQARLSEEPAVEQQLADLTRGYDQSKANFDDLLKKESESQMATSMEQMQEGERFTMLDPPSLPVKPDFPNRLKMCGAGLGAGMALGLLMVAGLEFFDDRLHTDKQIRSLLPVAVVAEVPKISSPQDAGKRKRRLVLGWAMTALIVAAIAGGSAFSYLHD
jgi:polysaccharide biosynthesis transport protein